jgi:hypothetical protein
MVREYTVHAETAEGTTRDEGLFARFEQAMSATPGALDAAVLLDVERGVLSATFQVRALGLDEAETIGGQLFANALRSAGLHGDRLQDVVEATEEPPTPRP